MDRLDLIEERLAHQMRLTEELSAELARQGALVATLERQVARLLAAEQERAREGAGGVFVGDERPPHY